MVLEETTIWRRRQALQILPSTLHDAFVNMIARVQGLPSGQAELAMRVLLLLHLAFRPLKLDEVRHALAVHPDNTELVNENIPTLKRILDCSLGLVIVDDKTSIIRFVHYSLEEHFQKHGDSLFPEKYSRVAEICLGYLNLRQLRSRCETHQELKQNVCEFKFLEYAACYWGEYVRQQPNKSVTALTLQLLRHHDKGHSCAIQVLFCSEPTFGSFIPRFNHLHPIPGQVLGVHAAAYFGLASVLRKQGIFEYWGNMDWQGRTPLALASQYGHDAAVKVLLKHKDVDVNAPIRNGYSPLSWAAVNGHDAVVKLLLKHKDIDINTKGRNYGISALTCAAWKGHYAVVKVLLEHRDIDVNTTHGDCGDVPLHSAANKGHNAVVQQLLGHKNINVNAKGRGGQSPIASAADNGHDTAVKLLLEHKDVDVNAMDSEGRSPLFLAVGKGHHHVVKLLLEHKDVHVNIPNRFGHSPLALAAQRGNRTIVQLLLAHKDTDVNAKCNDGLSPLAYAAMARQTTIIALLQEHQDIDVTVLAASRHT